MNKETLMINNYIDAHKSYQGKVRQLREKYNNTKDFQVMFGYLVMEIVSTDKSLMNLNRANIDLPLLSQKFFGKGK